MPSMETEVIKRIFGRNEETHKLQYTEYFGNGDSKAYNEVENCYEGVDVEKKECVGHVQKTVGTVPRNIKKENKAIGRKGKLTDALIDKLMPACSTVFLLKKETSTGNCPDGPDTWCRYKQDLANKTKLYKPGPGLPDNIIALIKPTHARLSDDDLLKKCLDGKTQNQNESLNGMIWNRLPKTVFVRADVLNFGAYDAVAHFNIGNKAAENILLELGLIPGHIFNESLRKGDKLRVKKA